MHEPKNNVSELKNVSTVFVHTMKVIRAQNNTVCTIVCTKKTETFFKIPQKKECQVRNYVRLGELSLQEKQCNNYLHCLSTRCLPAFCISFPNQSKKMKGCKRRGTFRCLLWRHVSLSLRDESTHSFLSRQKTRTFRQHVSFPHLPYLTQQCFCLPPFVPSLTLLNPTLLKDWRTAETHCAALWSFRTCMRLFDQRKHSRTSNSPYMHHFATQLNSNI